MTLPPQEIHVWLAFDREFEDEATVQALAALLEPQEREMAARKRAADLPRQSVITRALQRLVLSQYAPAVAPADWRFVASERGKPALAAEFSAHGLQFNVAHSTRLVAVAVGRHARLGVDVEFTGGRSAPLAVAPRYFSDDEAAALAALPADQKSRRFFALWTLKESWLKATGAGLAGGLGNVSFEFSDATRATGVRIRGDEAGGWNFWQAWPTAEHLLALAVQGAVEQVRLFRWSPGRELAGVALDDPRPVR